MTSIRITCPHCQRSIKVWATASGNSFACPRCHTRFEFRFSGDQQLSPPNTSDQRRSSKAEATHDHSSTRPGSSTQGLSSVSPPGQRASSGQAANAKKAGELQERDQQLTADRPRRRKWFSFSCPVCDTRLVDDADRPPPEVICPDCGSQITVPSSPVSSEKRARHAVLPYESSKSISNASEVDEYRLDEPVVSRPLLPPLFEVDEDELFAEPVVARPPAENPMHADSAPPDIRQDLPRGNVAAEHDRDRGAPSDQRADRYREAYRVACPLCDTRVLVWPHQAGQMMECPDCHTRFKIPHPRKPPQKRLSGIDEASNKADVLPSLDEPTGATRPANAPPAEK